jgi:hypothetical protein
MRTKRKRTKKKKKKKTVQYEARFFLRLRLYAASPITPPVRLSLSVSVSVRLRRRRITPDVRLLRLGRLIVRVVFVCLCSRLLSRRVRAAVPARLLLGVVVVGELREAVLVSDREDRPALDGRRGALGLAMKIRGRVVLTGDRARRTAGRSGPPRAPSAGRS